LLDLVLMSRVDDSWPVRMSSSFSLAGDLLEGVSEDWI
jgi:hypothetical protein